jgi:hypothetical protein
MLFKKKEIGIVFNTCGIRGDFSHRYIKNLEALLNQKSRYKIHIIQSDCLSSDWSREKVREKIGGRILYNYINDKLPVNLTFNFSARKLLEIYPNIEWIIYSESAITLEKYDISKLLLCSCNNIGYISGLVSCDNNLHPFVKRGLITEGEDTEKLCEVYPKQCIDLDIGDSISCHLMAINKKVFTEFNGGLPDIFAGFCSESVLTFMAASLGLRWVVNTGVKVSHETQGDGRSVGFDPAGNRFDRGFIIGGVQGRVRECVKYGLGYEECSNIIMHDASLFDGRLPIYQAELRECIKQNLFLQEKEFKYSDINHTLYKKVTRYDRIKNWFKNLIAKFVK